MCIYLYIYIYVYMYIYDNISIPCLSPETSVIIHHMYIVFYGSLDIFYIVLSFFLLLLEQF